MLEDLHEFAQTLQLRCCQVHFAGLSLVHLSEFEDPIRFRKRQRTKQHSIDNREYSSIGANAQGESEDSNSREAMRFAKSAQHETEVRKSGLEERQVPLIAVLFFGLFHAAEFEERVAAGRFERHSRAEVVFNMKLKMALQLYLEFCIVP